MTKSPRVGANRPLVVGQPGRRGAPLALVPARDLSNLPRWQHHARSLARGDILFVVPHGNGHLRAIAQQIQHHLSNRRIRVVLVGPTTS